MFSSFNSFIKETVVDHIFITVIVAFSKPKSEDTSSRCYGSSWVFFVRKSIPDLNSIEATLV